MRILYALPAISHPTMRGELRHHHFLQHLARCHGVTLVALSRATPDDEAVRDLRACTEQLVIVNARALDSRDRPADGLTAWRGRYAKQRRWKSALRELRLTLSRLSSATRFDAVLAYGSEIGSVSADLNGLPIVADICDAGSERLRQSLRYSHPLELPWRVWRWRKTARDERRLLQRTRHRVYISERDREAVEGTTRTAAVIPNGVDLEYWQASGMTPKADCIIFTGTMDYAPNADAAMHLIRKILPAVRARVPNVELVLAGRSPTDAVRRLAVRSGALVTGAVRDLRPYMERAAVFVAPLRFASGTQNKVLEAMAMELPVVTTSICTRGLQGSGTERPPVVVADKPAAFADAVVSLLQDGAARARLARQGRDYVSRQFSWGSSGARLEQVCLEAADEGRRVRA